MDAPNTLSLTQNGSAKISRVIRLEDKQVEDGRELVSESMAEIAEEVASLLTVEQCSTENMLQQW